MINTYEFYYEDIKLGTFQADIKEKLWKYNPDIENIESLKNKLILYNLFKTKVENWEKIPAFFISRIENTRRFDKNQEIISYHTDPYIFKLINGK